MRYVHCLRPINSARKEFKSASSFTLVELLVSMLIIGVLFAGTFLVLKTGRMTYFSDMNLLELEQGTRNAMNFMLKELRGSTNALIDSAEPSGITFLSDDGNSVEYCLIDSNADSVKDRIIRRGATGEDMILANDISELCFCWDASGSSCLASCSNFFTLRVKAAKTAMGRPAEFTLIEKVRLRN